MGFFTRKHCPLCDEGREKLREASHFTGVELLVRIHDVDAEPSLAEKYGDRVPVITIDGKERCWGRISLPLLKRTLLCIAERRG